MIGDSAIHNNSYTQKYYNDVTPVWNTHPPESFKSLVIASVPYKNATLIYAKN